MCDMQQSSTMASLEVFKTSSGKYALSTEEMEGTKIATFTDAGPHLPTVLTKLTLMDDNTVAEPLDVILATIHAELATELQETWTRYLTPCHRDSASNATHIKKTLKKRLGKVDATNILNPFRERILTRCGQATRLLVNPHGQTVALRNALPNATLPTLPIAPIVS